MVVVQCYHCSKILELDEGFRGGVCRCSQCGSLLQVPKAAAAEAGARSRPAAPGASSAEVGRPANPNEAAATRVETDPRSGLGSGLSGGVGSGIGNRPQRPDRPAAPGMGSGESGMFPQSPAIPSSPRRIEKVKPVESMGGGAGGGTGLSGMSNTAMHARKVKQNRMVLWVCLGLGFIVLTMGVVIAVLVAGGDKPTTNVAETQKGGSGGPKKTGPGAVAEDDIPDNYGPSNLPSPEERSTPRQTVGFFGIPFTGKNIVISIDSGGSMRDHYDFVRKGAMQAIKSLSANQQVRFVVWQSPPLVVPTNTWAKGNEINKLKAFDDSYASMGGQDEIANMTRSVQLGGDQVIFISAKTTWKGGVADEVMKARRGGTKIDTIWLNTSGDDDTFKTLAEKTKGTYRQHPPAFVHNYYRD